MKILNAVMIWGLFFMAITACNVNSTPSNYINPNQDKNNEISVSAPSQVNAFKINDFVTIIVQNNSEHEIALKREGINLLLKNGTDWVEIENSADFRDRILSPKANKDYSLTMIVVFPEVPMKESSVTVRVTIIGIDQLTNEKYQGYVDVILFP
jgi:hypothetical protein